MQALLHATTAASAAILRNAECLNCSCKLLPVHCMRGQHQLLVQLLEDKAGKGKKETTTLLGDSV